MELYSTRQQAPQVNFRQALFTGQAPDGGLYMPTVLPELSAHEIDSLASKSYLDFTIQMTEVMLKPELTPTAVETILSRAYNFAPVLKKLDEYTFCLELFHGPTLSFKDFGAQFMAQCMGHFIAESGEEKIILVATSGDTGSAVAHAYFNVEGIRIVLLYPSGKVSPLQEKQFTTLGGNIQALEIQGTFDDCQALVKQAFKDREIQSKRALTSANSINIGRLIPQSFYYAWAISQIQSDYSQNPLICVPSGNFGNLTAGMFAHSMNFSVQLFIAAVNANAVIPEYLETGRYVPRRSVRTLSNAMDVGDPSNWERILTLHNENYETIKNILWSTSVSDEATKDSISSVHEEFEYVIDPHTAVGFEAVRRFRRQRAWASTVPIVVLSTAHPGKFYEIVNETLQREIDLPVQLLELTDKKKESILLSNDYHKFKEYLFDSV